MMYDLKLDLLRQKAELKAQGKDFRQIEEKIIKLDSIPKKSKKPKVKTP